MSEFSSKKFIPLGFKKSYNNYTNEVEYKQNFIMTKTYKKYLDEKYKQELYKKIIELKNIFEYRQKNNIEIDDLEFNYYTYLLNKYYSID